MLASLIFADMAFTDWSGMWNLSLAVYVIYMCIIFGVCAIRLVNRAIGQHEDLFTAQVKGNTYLVEARHGKNKWLCLLCGEIKEKSEQQPVGIVPFHGGNISIWSIKDMTNITMRENEHYNIIPV